MTDALGWRAKFGVIVPSTNTIVQPEFDGMRPPGVTNHISRIHIPDMPLHNDADFNRLIALILAAQHDAIRRVMTCAPHRIVLGISAVTFWNGLDASRALRREIEAETGLGLSMGADACDVALKVFGVRRIGVITPYQPVGDENVRRYFEESGYEVVALRGLRSASPTLIAHETEETLRAAIEQVNVPEAEAIVQVGTNLAMARLAGEAERRLGKPVLAINTAIYWHALRAMGIADPVPGWGSLLAEH